MNQSYPEQRGNVTAKVVEVERVIRERERQAREDERRKIEGERSGVAADPPRKKRNYTSRYLTPEQHGRILRIVETHGRETVARWLLTLPKADGRIDPVGWARAAVRSLLDAQAPHKSTLFDLYHQIVEHYDSDKQPGEPESERLRGNETSLSVDVEGLQCPRQRVAETGVVQVVDDIAWTLPALTRAGAEQARIRLTDLANALGYSDKQSLLRLAERNASQMSELGETATVAVSVRQGFTSREVQEPTYNPDQAAYLALSSETEKGRACRVRILKAYKALVAMFEQIVQAPTEVQTRDPVLLQLLTQIAQSQNTMTALMASMQSQQTKRRKIDLSHEQVEIDYEDDPVLAKATDRKVLQAMIKRLAGVNPAMPEVEYGARMSVAYRMIQDELLNCGHDMREEQADAQSHGKRVNSLDWFEQKGVVRLAMQIVERLTAAKKASQ